MSASIELHFILKMFFQLLNIT